MSAILKFDFKTKNKKKKKQQQQQQQQTMCFSEVNNLNYTHKKPNFACDNYISPKTRENMNKQWTHSSPLK